MADHRPTRTSLASLRHDLEEIDRAIVLLVAARLEAAVAAIRLRSVRDGRVACPAQEARVLARAQSWGVRLGVDAALTETIFRAMLEAGKARFSATIPVGHAALSRRARTPLARGTPARKAASAAP